MPLTRCCSSETQNFSAFIAEINYVSVQHAKEEMDSGPDVAITGYKCSKQQLCYFVLCFSPSPVPLAHLFPHDTHE